MGFKNDWILISLILHFTKPALSGPTDLQKLMTTQKIPQSELIEKHKLVRLWPFNSMENGQLNIQDSVNSRFNRMSGMNKVVSRSIGVTPLMCGDRVYAKFNSGAVISDETMVLDDILKNGDYNWVQSSDNYIRRKAVAGTTLLGAGTEMLNPFTQLHSARLAKEILKPEIQQAIYNTTSFVSVNNDNREKRLQLDYSNYTIGGWFKPNAHKSGVTLFKKYFSRSGIGKPIVEWQIFYSGNLIYFHHYRDVGVSAETKYLSNEETRLFRARNAHFYDTTEFYSHVSEKKAILDAAIVPAAQKSDLPKKLFKVFVDMPIAYKNAKPIPEEPLPTPTNPPVVINPPPILPLPPGPIPVAPFPSRPYLLGYQSSGKDHTLGFDIKQFWWGSATTVGACYGCILPGVDHDVWHFFAVSVHLNDRLGPYLDLYIIRDPNAHRMGDKATLSANFRTRRIELDKEDMSRPLRTPVAHSYLTEKGCDQPRYCTKSELEIGSFDNDRPYSGYMRGVFISKQALGQSSLFELAAEFNPNDTLLCTYNKK